MSGWIQATMQQNTINVKVDYFLEKNKLECPFIREVRVGRLSLSQMILIDLDMYTFSDLFF